MATDTGLDPKLWHELATMGLIGLLIGEEYAGAGAGPVEMGIAMEEMGRVLLVSPFPACWPRPATRPNAPRCCLGSRQVT